MVSPRFAKIFAAVMALTARAGSGANARDGRKMCWDEAEKAQLEAELEARKRNKSSAVEQAETPQPEPEPEQEPEATVGVTRPASPVREAARQEVCGDEVAFDDGDRDTSDSQPMLFQ